MIDLPALAHIPSIVAALVAALSVPALVPHLLLAIAGVGAGDGEHFQQLRRGARPHR
ncbi:hypothetical protein Pd630_LPD09029 (plasmid) [Rhodococcus opacus PD630]|nr:hypothetical protein Pd630_LPD09029 [Rhodococcus opacus PD630]